MDSFFFNSNYLIIYEGKSHMSRKSHNPHKSNPTNPWDGIYGDGRDLSNSEKQRHVPVVNHEFLNGEERLVADVGVVVREQAHHERLASQLFQNTKEEEN